MKYIDKWINVYYGLFEKKNLFMISLERKMFGLLGFG